MFSHFLINFLFLKIFFFSKNLNFGQKVIFFFKNKKLVKNEKTSLCYMYLDHLDGFGKVLKFLCRKIFQKYLNIKKAKTLFFANISKTLS